MSFTIEQIEYLEANRSAVEARRLFEVHFTSASYYLCEGSTPLNTGGRTWQPAHDLIAAEPIAVSNIMDAHPAVYRTGRITPALSLAHLTDQAEWQDAPIIQRLQLLVDGRPVGPPIHLHRGKIADIRRRETVSEDYFEIRAEGPFRDRNATMLGQYTDRDQQMRSPGDRGCEYAAQMVEHELTGWLKG
ncbi:MAG: hypothetical protein Q4G36_08180 [Paracoccus sp. (in: a-proteobacteria)]|nr:hypothetical protein [Paracoccus sp. (in: a-proteobacteria)]